MSEQRNPPRDWLKPALKERGQASTVHPSFDQLVAYHHDQLPQQEQQWIENHITACQKCADLFKDIVRFFDSLPEEAAMSNEQLTRAWKEFRRATAMKASPMAEESLKEESIQSPPRRAPRGFVARRKVFVLVTCFILIILALGGMSVYLWWSNKQLRANQEQQERQVARLFEQAQRLEQENQGLKQNNDARIAELNEQIKQLTAPQPNWPIYDVYAVAFLRQSGGARKVNEIQLSADVKGFTLILNPENPRRYTDYTIEILDSHDQIVWRGEELKRNALDGFNLTVNREGLPESRYTIKVYGKTAAGSQLIDEYPIVIK